MLIQPILFKNRICIFFRKIIADLKHLEPSGVSHPNSRTFELKDLLIILCEIAHNLCSFNPFCLKIEFTLFFEIITYLKILEPSVSPPEFFNDLWQERFAHKAHAKYHMT